MTTTTATTVRITREQGPIGFRQQSIPQRIIKSGVIGLVVFSPLALGSVHPWAYTLIEVVVLCLYLCWIIQFLSHSRPANEPRWKLTLIRTPLNIPLCLVIGVILFQITPLPSWLIACISPSTHKLYLSILASGYEATTRTISIYPWASTRELYKLLAYVGIFFLAIYHFRDRVWLNRLVKAVVTTAFFVAVIGLLQHYTVPDKIYGFRDASYAHPFGPYVNRNHFAGYMEMAIFVAIGLLLAQWRKIRLPEGRWRAYLSHWEASISKEFLLAFSVIVMAVALALSLSRGGIASSLVAVVFTGTMMLMRKRRSSFTVLVVLFSCALFYLLWLGIGPVIERLSTVRYWDTLEVSRIKIWHGSLDIIRDFLSLGTGLCTFVHIYPLYQTIESRAVFDHAHNDYLEFFSDLGLVGGVFVWGGLIWFLIWILKRWSERRHPYVVGVCLGTVTGAVSLLLHSAVDFNLHIPANALLFFVLLAVGFNTVLLSGEGAVMEVVSPARVVRLSRRWGRLLLFLTFCVLVLFAGGVIRNYLAARALNDVRQKVNLYTRGERASWVDADTVTRLQRARDLSPHCALSHYFLAKAYEQMALAQRERKDRDTFLDNVAEEYKTAINLEPTYAWYHLGLGWTYLILSERDPSLQAYAKKEFEIAARLAPNNPDIQSYLRQLYKSWAETS